MLDVRTPPLLRARTCSIVLSACRGDERENVRAWPFGRLMHAGALFAVSRRHVVLLPAVVRRGGATFGLWTVAKARRTEHWTDVRRADEDARAFAAPATQLGVVDIPDAIPRRVRRGAGVGGVSGHVGRLFEML